MKLILNKKKFLRLILIENFSQKKAAIKISYLKKFLIRNLLKMLIMMEFLLIQELLKKVIFSLQLKEKIMMATSL